MTDRTKTVLSYIVISAIVVTLAALAVMVGLAADERDAAMSDMERWVKSIQTNSPYCKSAIRKMVSKITEIERRLMLIEKSLEAKRPPIDVKQEGEFDGSQ